MTGLPQMLDGLFIVVMAFAVRTPFHGRRP